MGLREREIAVLLKFANHRSECRCFICKTLSQEERNTLDFIWNKWLEAGADGPRKS